MTTDIISIFDCQKIETDEKLVFVLMPFREDRTKIFDEIVRPLVVNKGYDCVRADDVLTNTNKINEIVRQIWKSKFIIADITGINPNVLYEVGFAHAMKKEVIMIYEKKRDEETEFPFDTRHIDTIIYNSDSTGADSLRERLKKTIEYVQKKIIDSEKEAKKKKVEEAENYSNFEIRRGRIRYFTRIAISHLNNLKRQHQTLTKYMNNCANEAKSK